MDRGGGRQQAEGSSCFRAHRAATVRAPGMFVTAGGGLLVSCPAVDGPGCVENRLGNRRVRMDDPGELLVATLELDHAHELGNHVAGPVAHDVSADDLSVF